MKKKDLRQICSPVLAGGALVVCLGLMSGCVAANEVVRLPYEANPEDFSLVQASAKTSVNYDVQDYVENSELIVRGTVTEAEGPLLIEPKNGLLESSKYYTDYCVQVDEVLFSVDGDKALDTSVVVRTEGGVGADVLMVADDDPELRMGADYLLFLRRYSDTSLYKTDDDVYMIVGAIGGAWDASQSGTYASREMSAAVSDEELQRLIDLCGGMKLDEGANNHLQFLEEIRAREAAGELPPGSYQRYVNEEERLKASKATVLPASQHAAFEAAFLASQEGGLSSGSIA